MRLSSPDRRTWLTAPLASEEEEAYNKSKQRERHRMRRSRYERSRKKVESLQSELKRLHSELEAAQILACIHDGQRHVRESHQLQVGLDCVPTEVELPLDCSAFDGGSFTRQLSGICRHSLSASTLLSRQCIQTLT